VESPDEPSEENAVEVKTVPLPKVNAVAHEAPVKVTGARPANAGGERELFTESTTTVLVFEKGGVITLTAAVAPGQLLFLSNEETKREVVAQVTRKRAHRPTDCYVELEFTELAPKFWGMEFSAATALLPKDKKQQEAAALVASAEATADEPGQPAPSASSEEVMALKKEVEALRKQLNSLQTPGPAAGPTAGIAPESKPTLVPVEAPALPAQAPTVSAEAAAPAAPPAVVANYESIGVPVPVVEDEPIAFAAKSLPVEPEPRPAELTSAEHELLPKPALDFSMSLPKRKNRSFRARGNFTPGFRTGILRVALLGTILVITIIGAAWYKDWLPWKHTAKKIAVASYAAPVSPVVPASGTDNGTRGTGVAVAQPASGKKGTEAAPPENHSIETANPGSAIKPSGSVASEPPVDSSVPNVVTTQPSGRGKPATITPAGKRTPVRVTPSSGADPTVSPEEALIVPPKLLRSAPAVATLDDLRDFETGSVFIDALIDTSGMVTTMNVLSGPPSLRDAAMQALRDYRYVPATRNGKPIPAHVKVKIQFHFE
jgi:protein TonB